MTAALRRPLTPGVEWEYERITIAREYPRSVVTKMLVERAEHGGWELDRVRVAPDGTRRVVLRRKIIRVRPTLYQHVGLTAPVSRRSGSSASHVLVPSPPSARVVAGSAAQHVVAVRALQLVVAPVRRAAARRRQAGCCTLRRPR